MKILSCLISIWADDKQPANQQEMTKGGRKKKIA